MGNIDIVSDMLIRIKNANMIKSSTVIIIKNCLTLSITKLLKDEGFIESFEECGPVYLTENSFVNKHISLTLKYKGIKQNPYITNLKRISKPGLRVYVNCRNIPKVLGGIGTAVCASSKGILTDRMAKSINIGGEILFYIW
uniref:ribosomal protein S8 n=1 Tax=Euglena deses TaxID=66845 RepID=UPI0023AA341E|nr:ribosomal protein S8 [Euglena deses]WCH63375.1 ribosomal protein S8 [Euglena deses]